MKSTKLASELRTAVSSLHKSLRRQMSSVNTYSMTEIETIAHLARFGSLLPTELAALTKVKTQSMSQILKEMEDHQVIKRTPSKDDKRKVFISLTVTGKNLVEKAKYDKDEWLTSAIENTLTEKEKDLLLKVIPLLLRISESR
jgi:DNA-binding MarR family transcriptional regulator